MATEALSKSQFDQLEATLKANRARLGAATRAPRRHRDSRAVLRTRGTAARERRNADQSRRRHHHARRHQRHQARFLGAGKFPGHAARGAGGARHGAGLSRARSFTGKVSSIDSRVDMNTRSVTVRALLANEDGALRPGHVPQRLAGERRARRADHPGAGADARGGAPVRVRGDRRQGRSAAKCASAAGARAASKCSPASTPANRSSSKGRRRCATARRCAPRKWPRSRLPGGRRRRLARSEQRRAGGMRQ